MKLASTIEHKKRECWDEYTRQCVHEGKSAYDVFCAAFDRAYALGKQERDAEGEEMLTVSRKRVQEIYSYNEEILSQDQTHSGAILLKKKLTDLFGSKCLPDEACNIASNVASSKPYVDSSEPKPAEPTCTDDVPTCTDDCSSQCSSQDFDTIIKDGFSKERRLNIAAMMMQGMLSNTTRFSSYEISDLVRISLNCADALIAEVEKGGLQ